MGRKQLHAWVSEDDHAFLRLLGRDKDLSVGALLRRVIRALRRRDPGMSTRSGVVAAATGSEVPASSHVKDPSST